MRHNRWEANLWFTICRIVYCEHHCILGDYPFVWWANLCVTAGGYMCQMTLIVRVLACLAEGLGMRATARVFEVDPNTVLHWLVEAAELLRAFSCYFLCEVHVQQLQLDELYAVLSAVKNGVLSEDEAIKRLERSPSWRSE